MIEERLTYKWKDLIKHVKKFSFWKGSEVLRDAKKICDKQKRELISDIQTDLDELVEWCKYLPVDSEINIRLGRKVEKWEKKK